MLSETILSGYYWSRSVLQQKEPREWTPVEKGVFRATAVSGEEVSIYSLGSAYILEASAALIADAWLRYAAERNISAEDSRPFDEQFGWAHRADAIARFERGEYRAYWDLEPCAGWEMHHYNVHRSLEQVAALVAREASLRDQVRLRQIARDNASVYQIKDLESGRVHRQTNDIEEARRLLNSVWTPHVIVSSSNPTFVPIYRERSE